MTWSAQFGGKVFTETSVEGNNYADEENGFPAILQAVAEEMALFGGAAGLSVTSITPGAGATVLTLLAAPPVVWEVGRILRASSTGSPDHFLTGTITEISGNDVTLDVQFHGGATARADWVITYPLFASFLEKSGGILTGALEVAAALLVSGGGVTVSGGDVLRTGAAGTDRAIWFQSDGSNRIALVATGDAETGSDAGTDFEIRVYDDAGALLSTPFKVDRATGLVTLGVTGFVGAQLRNAELTGTSFDVGDLGDVSVLETITVASANALKATLIGSTTFDFTSLGAGKEFTRKLKITQGGAGGFEPTWHVDSAPTNVTRINPAPNYATQTAGTITRVTAEVSETEMRVWETEEA